MSIFRRFGGLIKSWGLWGFFCVLVYVIISPLNVPIGQLHHESSTLLEFFSFLLSRHIFSTTSSWCLYVYLETQATHRPLSPFFFCSIRRNLDNPVPFSRTERVPWEFWGGG
jgi:hypothetical protein